MTVPSSCSLCGLPAAEPAVRDGGQIFCCLGCREVYRCFGDLRSAAARPVAGDVPARSRTAYLWIDGMHCASCEHLIERLALDVRGVFAASSSYATSTARIVYDPEQIDEHELPARLGRLGYRARLRDSAPTEYDERSDLLRLFTGGCLAAVVMMLTMVFVYPIHAGLAVVADFEPMRWVAFELTPKALFVLSTILVFYVGAPILRGAWIGIRVGLLNMDGLLALSVLASYGYSVVQLFHDPFDLYFEVAATLVAAVTIGRFLERSTRVEATRELNRIMRSWPQRACVSRNGQTLFCGVDEVDPGDRVFVRQGEQLPVDGSIVRGQAALDESLITGEPFPVSRGPGEQVRGGSVLLEGRLEIEPGPEVGSRMADLAQLLWNMQSARAGVAGRVDRLSRLFVPAVLVLAAGVGVIYHVGGAPMQQVLLASLATLIVSCPCTFGLAMPLTQAAAIASALRRGIIVCSADLFERSARVDVVAIDKTGTLSTGEMEVLAVIGAPEVSRRAAAVERLSVHPVAKAIARLDGERTARGDIEIHPGQGAVASVGGQRVAVGGKALFETLDWRIPEPLASEVASRASGECVVSYVGWGGTAHGAIVTRDQPRPEWERVVTRLRRDRRVVLLTGAQHPGAYAAHVDEVHAGVPPEAKAAVVRGLRAGGRVAMVGDGSNDAPAMAEADLGIAFGAPTALAVQSADIVIPGQRLERVFDALALIASTRRRIRQNLGWALAYNAIAIPLAASGNLNPLWAALAMAASSVLVVVNATRPILAAGGERQPPGAPTAPAACGAAQLPAEG